MPRSGTVLILLFAAVQLVTFDRAATAAIKDFPYQAVVEADEVFARCGPGKSYYATSRLKRGDRVIVRRHDPGGWFMIEPPADSFSLIRADDVERQGNLGVVKQLDQGQASVRVGSVLDATADSYFQRRLSTGERVEILGEITMPRHGVPVRMYKLRSPRGEFRWIEGMNLVPLDPRIRQENDADPFSTPTQALEAQNRRPAGSQAIAGVAAKPVMPGVMANGSKAASPRGQGNPVAATTASLDPRGRLDEIDVQFRDMVRREPRTWNLAQIEQAYRELQQQQNVPSIRSQIELRMTAVDHYKDVKAGYDDYFRLVSTTSRRDAELAAIQNSTAPPQDARPPVQQYPQFPSTQSNDSRLTGPVYQGRGPSGPANMPNPQAAPAMMPQLALQPQPAGNASGGPVLGPPTPDATAPMPVQDRNSVGDPGAIGPNTPVPEPQNTPVQNMPAQSGLGQNTPFPTTSNPSESPAAMPNFPDQRSAAPIVSGPGATGANPAMPPSRPAALEGSISTAPFTPVPTEAPASQNTAPQNMPAATPRAMTGPQPGSMLQPGLLPQQGLPPQQNLAPQQGLNGSNGFEQMQPGPAQPATTAPPAMRNAPTRTMTPPLAPPRQIRQNSYGLDGAGVVQRAATAIPGGPQHVLLAPNGRILAYLFPERGVNLDAYVGRQMGVMGQRMFRPELQTDLIIVRQMIPVRLVVQ